MRRSQIVTLGLALVLLVSACTRDTEKVAESRYIGPDSLYRTMEENVRANQKFELILDIDHSRLAAEVDSPMPPSHVLIWSDPELESAMLKYNPLVAMDLPLRALAFEATGTGEAAVIANSYDYVANRHSLPDDEFLRDRYEAALAQAMKGIPQDAISSFPSDLMESSGLVTLDSPYDFETTERHIAEAINAQSDTVNFGRVDFAARAKDYGIDLEPIILILFGGPGPGGKAMSAAPTLGLDAFCQKLLIWQDAEGTVHVTFNDLLVLAERQRVPIRIPLRVINRRIQDTFAAALKD